MKPAKEKIYCTKGAPYPGKPPDGFQVQHGDMRKSEPVFRNGHWFERLFCPNCNQEFYSISEACRAIEVMYPDKPLEVQRKILLGALGLLDKFDEEQRAKGNDAG